MAVHPALLNFRPAQAEILPHQIAFNCLPQCGDFLDNAYTQEEMALILELRKLLGAPDLPVTATAAYVPLAHSHSASVTLETAQPLSVFPLKPSYFGTGNCQR